MDPQKRDTNKFKKHQKKTQKAKIKKLKIACNFLQELPHGLTFVAGEQFEDFSPSLGEFCNYILMSFDEILGNIAIVWQKNE